MRYYRIEIDGGKTVYTSFANGITDRGALQVELDIPVADLHEPLGGAYVKIWGIPLATISQANNLKDKNVKVYGGFQKGLPLANPKQSGLLVQGKIQQAFGNWLGTDMSLDLIITPAPPQMDQPDNEPRNISIAWKKGQPLGEAIKSALATGYPGMTVNVKTLNSSLIAPEDQPGFYRSAQALAIWLNKMSRSIVNRPDYHGVRINFDGNTINVYDAPGTTPKAIAFVDLIGQPTWINAPLIAFKTMMRADIALSDQVTMPKTLITNSQQAQSALVNQAAAQQGAFQITSVHHFGNFRQRDAYSWVTEFNAAPLNSQAAT